MNDRSRVLLSVVIVAIGVVAGTAAGVLGYSEDTTQANGTVIDFSEYDTVWTDAELSDFPTTLALLQYACGQNGYEIDVDGGTGEILSINGVGGDGEWTLWVTYSGSTEWVELSYPYDQNASDYSITSWTYSTDGREPTIAVDYTGSSYHGFSQKYRVVSLSPTVTEILYSVGAKNLIVGVDMYSDYPADIVSRTDSGSVEVVGSYTSPSLELILGTNPDLVICDGSQTSHVNMASTLRSQGIDVIVTYPGEDISQVLDNIYMIGNSIGYDIAADLVIEDTQYVLDMLTSAIGSSDTLSVMVSLEPDISPWVSGSDTYMDGIVAVCGGSNVFSEWSGWVHITSDRIPYTNPEVIIIITTEYAATEEEYEYLYDNLNAQWQLTDAWKNGRVYVICESAAEMAQRCGPRIAHDA